VQVVLLNILDRMTFIHWRLHFLSYLPEPEKKGQKRIKLTQSEVETIYKYKN